MLNSPETRRPVKEAQKYGEYSQKSHSPGTPGPRSPVTTLSAPALSDSSSPDTPPRRGPGRPSTPARAPATSSPMILAARARSEAAAQLPNPPATGVLRASRDSAPQCGQRAACDVSACLRRRSHGDRCAPRFGQRPRPRPRSFTAFSQEEGLCGACLGALRPQAGVSFGDLRGLPPPRPCEREQSPSLGAAPSSALSHQGWKNTRCAARGLVNTGHFLYLQPRTPLIMPYLDDAEVPGNRRSHPSLSFSWLSKALYHVTLLLRIL
ncbi:putative uncharacterized protein encoded by LINC00271 [Nomascus leucogenys]|uniref:putative uncharacterized protein encoded by LINC00271 n=1 Tax=Nomascus leucogenys TaxID=61853 RepID=UPI00122D669E|nr:putative uncharacterized protein encoded by LINC00271 [Nomascus leucogenys]